MPDLIPPYHRSLQMHIELVETLRSHTVSFEEARHSLTKWVSQPHLEANEWVTEWEDLCAAEVDRWYAR